MTWHMVLLETAFPHFWVSFASIVGLASVKQRLLRKVLNLANLRPRNLDPRAYDPRSEPRHTMGPLDLQEAK